MVNTKKKTIKNIHDVGDIILGKKENSSWKLKQYQRLMVE